MSGGIHPARTFALSVLALYGLTILIAAGAQANWVESGKEVTFPKNVLAKAHTTGTLSISKLNFEIRCTTLQNETAGLKIVASSTIAEGKVKFSGCTAFQISDGKEQKSCKPTEPIVAGGLALIVKLASVGGQAASLRNYFLLEPQFGTPFTTIKFSELCPLVETSNISGSLVAECGLLKEITKGVFQFVSEDCGISQVSHLLRPGPATLWKGEGHGTPVLDELLFGLNPASAGGISAVELESHNSWYGFA